MARKTEVLLFRWLRPHHFVFLMAAFAFLGFISGYAISISRGVINYFLPKISDTGALPPASCVFGLMLNISAICGVVVIVLRHRHLEAVMNNGMITCSPKILVVNDVGLFLGVLSCLGMMVVACFQKTGHLHIHNTGATMVFLFGIVYSWLQSYISFVTNGEFSTTSRTVVRIILSVIEMSAAVFFVVFQTISKGQTDMNVLEQLLWKADQPGYASYIVSSFSEWTMGICFVAFFTTFYHDFKSVVTNVSVTCTLPVAEIEMEEQQTLA